MLMAQALQDKEAIMNIIQNLFEGMQKGDSAAVRNIFAPATIISIVNPDNSNQELLIRTPVQKFLKSIGTAHAETLRQVIRAVTLMDNIKNK